MVEKCDFLQVVKIPYPKNQFLVILRSFFSTHIFSQGGNGFFLLVHSKGSVLKMSSLAGLKKSYSISRKSTDFGHSWQLKSTIKVNFLNLQTKFQKTCGQFAEAGC